jgi:hypothetical protein
MSRAYRDDGVSATDIWATQPGEEDEQDLVDGSCTVM